MMVEWDDAILTFNISSNLFRLTKHAGFSFFTFVEKTEILINFHSPISFFTLHSPYLSSSDGAIQITSNIKENQFQLSKTQSDIYLSIYSPYNLASHLSASVFGKYTLHYYTNTSKTTKNVESVNLEDINYVTIFQTHSGRLGGDIELNNTITYSPTIPTCIQLSFSKIDKINCYNGNKAYGGSYINNTQISKNFLDFEDDSYVFISHNLNQDDYDIYVNNSNGEIIDITESEIYSEIHDYQFSVDILVISSKCENYSLVATVNSSDIELTKDGYLQVYKITNGMISDECRITHVNKIERVGKIVSVSMASLVVAAIIIGVIVLIVVRARRNLPSYNERDDSDVSNSS